jgi:hypothetical protein
MRLSQHQALEVLMTLMAIGELNKEKIIKILIESQVINSSRNMTSIHQDLAVYQQNLVILNEFKTKL